MAFTRVPYLEWAHDKPSVRFNLSGSSAGVTSPDRLGFSFEGITFCGPNEHGYKPLLAAIAARFGLSPAEVATAGGTSMANFLVCAALIRPGDTVVVEKPCYGPMLDVPRALGAKIRRLERRFENGYQFDPADLRKLLDRKTRLVLLTNLHNPSGVRTPDGTLREIADIAQTLRVHILVDEVYLDFASERDYRTVANLGRYFVSTNSLTKVYGLDGLRCGWILANEKLIRRIWQVRDFVDANGAFPAEFISARLFDHLPRILSQSRKLLEINFPMVRRFVESRPELRWVPPDGGAVSFPRYRGAGSVQSLWRILHNDFDTLIVPGRFFESPRNFRLGCGVPAEILNQGLVNLGYALDRLLNTDPA